ncbi:MAG: hypothetical protein IPH57_16180 [Saprospiraceae bacterium]|nr:hypothetical protein [Saprospiraceae bacterium]
MELTLLQKKINQYNEVLKNTDSYREKWETETKGLIVSVTKAIIEQAKLNAEVEIHDQYSGLEGVSLVMGIKDSGIFERLDDDLKKSLIRSNGSLLFQQLFNGKISVWINYPFIEGIGEPRPPAMLEILRPQELKEVIILRFVEQFIDDLTTWEDFDDDKSPTQGIGFNHPQPNLKQANEIHK